MHLPVLIGRFVLPRWKNMNKRKQSMNVMVLSLFVCIEVGGRIDCIYVGVSIRYGD